MRFHSPACLMIAKGERSLGLQGDQAANRDVRCWRESQGMREIPIPESAGREWLVGKRVSRMTSEWCGETRLTATQEC